MYRHSPLSFPQIKTHVLNHQRYPPRIPPMYHFYPPPEYYFIVGTKQVANLLR